MREGCVMRYGTVTATVMARLDPVILSAIPGTRPGMTRRSMKDQPPAAGILTSVWIK